MTTMTLTTPCEVPDGLPPHECRNDAHDHYIAFGSYDGDPDAWPKNAEWSITHRDEVIPATCQHCGRPSFYCKDTDTYHHAVDPEEGCFLIGPETTATTLDPRTVVTDLISAELAPFLTEKSDEVKAVIAGLPEAEGELLSTFADDLLAALDAAVCQRLADWRAVNGID